MTEYTAINHEMQTAKNGKKCAEIDFATTDDKSAVIVTFFEDGAYHVRIDHGHVRVIRIA